MSISNKESAPKRLGILGGTFNPIHSAHISIAKAALEQLALEKVIILVNGYPPHKSDDCNMASKQDRYNMVCLAAEDFDFLVPVRYELDKEEKSYTCDSISYFKDLYAEYELCFIIGEDNLFEIEGWKNPEYILKNCRIVAAVRNDTERAKSGADYLIKKYSAKVEILSNKIEYISSTDIRNRIQKGIDCTGLLPNAVIKYIIERGLYK